MDRPGDGRSRAAQRLERPVLLPDVALDRRLSEANGGVLMALCESQRRCACLVPVLDLEPEGGGE